MFRGNRWTKKQRNGDAISVPTSTSVLLTEEIEVTGMQTDQELGNCCQNATPTRSEVKLQDSNVACLQLTQLPLFCSMENLLLTEQQVQYFLD